jgi:sensor c-di-GMP phosphodiesterase-like protein
MSLEMLKKLQWVIVGATTVVGLSFVGGVVTAYRTTQAEKAELKRAVENPALPRPALSP